MNAFLCAFLLSGMSCLSSVAASPALLLTPYILNNQTELARNLSKVDPKLFLNRTSYSGYFTVDTKHNSNLFFWYYPVENQTVTEDTPWIVWLQGGPGSSSLVGLFAEIGPFTYDKTDTLKPREWSWNRKYPLLFIDNPVGSGYSFTDSPDGLVRNIDQCAEHLFSALQQFLAVFPEYRRAPLFLAGESYAGHFLPAFGQKILHPPALPQFILNDSSVNLKGIMMGNPVVDRRDFVNMSSVYYHWGLIDSQGMEAVRLLQEAYSKAVQENKLKEAYDARDKLWDALEQRSAQAQSYNVMKGELPEVWNFERFVTQPAVREAIHVGDIKFTGSNQTVGNALMKDFLVSLTPQVEELLEHYRIMIYCGQLDLVAPCVDIAEARRKKWRWSGRQAFLTAHRTPWWHDDVAGYVKRGGNFTEVLVRGAGHIVPMDKPSEAFQLIDFFIRDLDFPEPTNYDESLNDTPPYHDDPPRTKTETPTPATNSNSGFIASIVLNVLFVCVIIAGLILGIRWKRRTDSYFYSMVDNSSLNGVLTMD